MKIKAYVIRIWLDDDGQVQGQISDPHSDWRRPFREPDKLFELIRSHIERQTDDARPNDRKRRLNDKENDV